MDLEPNLNLFRHATAKIDHIFVYGTLKRGDSREGCLQGCTFVKNDTMRGYMFHQGGFPAIVLEGSGTNIHGEVWSLPPVKEDRAALMATLDAIEGHPHHYWRIPVKTFGGTACWVYFQSRDKITKTWKIITSGIWNGSNTPCEDFEFFMNSKPGHQFPTKPRVKYNQDTSCMCVEQYDVGNAQEYTEISKQDSIYKDKGVSYDQFYTRQRPKRKPDPAPRLISLQYLDASGEAVKKIDELDTGTV